MIKILRKLIWKTEHKINNIRSYFYNKHLQKLYPDYKEDEYNCGSLKFIWGIKSWDDLTGKDSNIYTMNDIDITYNRKEKKYYLGIETAYLFKDKKAIPQYPKKIGVITSASGKAVKDIVNNIEKRWPAEIIVWNTTVQGEPTLHKA